MLETGRCGCEWASELDCGRSEDDVVITKDTAENGGSQRAVRCSSSPPGNGSFAPH